MNEAAIAPVRVPAGRQGGPRTHCAAGRSRELQTERKKHYKKHKETSKGRPERPVLLASARAVGGAASRVSVPWWSMSGARLPMFPLSAVLFPHATMPLHVFEPRYRELMRDCLAGDRRFGVVLIARGSEVGGGDERSALGTRGVITEASELPDGRWVLIVEGESLIMVDEWLPDDPYPVALVRDVEPVPELGDATPLVGRGRAAGPPRPSPAGRAGRRPAAPARSRARR